MTLQQMADLAAWHDTTVAWAFRRALLVRGIVVRLPRTRRPPKRRSPEDREGTTWRRFPRRRRARLKSAERSFARHRR